MQHSPSSLNNHLACTHLTHRNREVARGKLTRPVFADPVKQALIDRGFAHEDAYIAHLADRGHSLSRPVEVDDKGREDISIAMRRTRDAMTAGIEFIVQARLAHDSWNGFVDVLQRVERASDLGAFSYEPIDTKLTQTTKAGTLLQLCIYARLLEPAQGRLPEHLHVVTPGTGFQPETYRTHDYLAYTDLAMARMPGAEVDLSASFPDPVGHCQICEWWQQCQQKRREVDHPTLVAGLTRSHAQELATQGVETLAALATASLRQPKSGSLRTLERLQRQARVQLASQQAEAVLYELVDLDPETGLHLLPAPSPGDIFFDIESARMFESGGLEYLFGVTYRRDGGDSAVERRWAYDRGEEKQAFEWFIDFVVARLRADPEMHVYHFGGYETGAIKRLMTRHATRQTEVDEFLRAGRFVDLHKITRQAVRAGVEQYSLKSLEGLIGFERAQDLREASLARHRFEAALDTGTARETEARSLGCIERYNEEDCRSTDALRVWLEARRDEWIARGATVPRSEARDGAASETTTDRDAAIQKIADQLLEGVPESDRDAEQEALWILAHLLPYYRREEKSTTWEYYRLAELEPEEAAGERYAVIDLEYVGRTPPPPRSKSPFDRYRFPPQEVAIKIGGKLLDMHATDEAGRPSEVGELHDIDFSAGWLEIKKPAKALDHHPQAVFNHDFFKTRALEESLLACGEHIATNGFDKPGPWIAAADLLRRRRPRVGSAAGESLRHELEDTLQAGKRLTASMAGGVLPIQGPPGTGKSYSAARIIIDKVHNGASIAVTANSHAVITNLLAQVVAAAERPIRIFKKPRSKKEELPEGVESIGKNDAILAEIDAPTGCVLGATVWTWAHADLEGKLDYLVVDEAGQLSLAHTVAASRCSANLVLVGDPQQLQQPQKGAHPEGCEAAALVHLLDGEQTVPTDRGLFLDATYRMHPTLTEFTSRLYYEDRLGTHESCARQRLDGVGEFDGVGMHWIPVAHSGNQARSIEEVAAVADLVQKLTRPGARWTNREGDDIALTLDQILIVAPFNAQVNALEQAIPGAKVGTVDRFQGQQAAVVIYSMTSSSAEDAPRGIGFLYDPHRLNVATSRAHCAVFVVASPQVCVAVCGSPAQLRMVNGVCAAAASPRS